MEGYTIITSFVRPAYSFVEGADKEHWWMDAQNCWYYMICEETDELTNQRHDGKQYWIIEPHKPQGVIITKENFKEIAPQIKWLVTDTSNEEDEGKEWDFKNHCVINETSTT